MTGRVTIRPVEDAADLELVRVLFREYEAGVGAPQCFVGFETELAALPGDYGLPGGALLLAWVDGAPAGCVALKALGGRMGEMKRLYVRPAFRAFGLGRRLVEAVIGEAKAAGCRALRLDTLPSMAAAQALYRDMGFQPIGAYSDTPSALHFELRLAA